MTVPDLTNQIIDHFQLTQRLQQRPFTTLYRGQDTQLVRPVFVEVMNSTIAADEKLAGRFQRRLETVRQLEHPHIAPILQVGRVNLSVSNGSDTESPQQYVYAIIQYVPGPTLAQQLESWRQAGQRPDVLEALTWIHGLASALAVAHPVGIFHHDLRPDHLILSENGRLTFIDLGLPIAPQLPIAPPNPQNPPSMLDYASPEQLDGKPLSGASNIYSLGILLYELLAGHRPRLPLSNWNIFERSELPREVPLEEVRTDLTEATYAVVKNCLWRQDWNRYETANKLVSALVNAHRAEEADQPLPTPVHHLLQQPLWLYIGLGLLIVLLLLGGFRLF